MTAAGLSINGLAAATRRLDPNGKGVKPATIGFVVSKGKSAREGLGDEAAELIAAALHAPVESLFETDDAFLLASESTSTPGEQMPTPNDPWVTGKQLAAHLGKSEHWVYMQRRKYADTSTPLPCRLVGRTPRYQISAVEAWLDEVYGAVAA
jgi:predicted DNA-binding transcriptional regulator AlpA